MNVELAIDIDSTCMSIPMLRRFNFDARLDRDALPTSDAANILIQKRPTLPFDPSFEVDLHPLVGWSMTLLMTLILLQLCRVMLSQIAYAIMSMYLLKSSPKEIEPAHVYNQQLKNISSYINPQNSNKTTLIYGISEIDKKELLRRIRLRDRNVSGVVYWNVSDPRVEVTFLSAIHYPLPTSCHQSAFYRIVNEFLRVASDYVKKKGVFPTLLIDVPPIETMSDHQRIQLFDLVHHLKVNDLQNH